MSGRAVVSRPDSVTHFECEAAPRVNVGTLEERHNTHHLIGLPSGRMKCLYCRKDRRTLAAELGLQ